jgi:predicted GIY-YIG superfamily endonuclease
MLPDELSAFSIFSAEVVVAAEERLPEQPGVYIFFVRGGNRLLRATSYYDLDGRHPLGFRRHHHLYTGAASDLRRRLKQHMAFIAASSLRRSPFALEHYNRAISRSDTPGCMVKGERTLTEWLCRNALIGIELGEHPLERERYLLSRYASPLNLTLRRREPYARALSAMRRAAFPSSDIGCVERLRGK